MALVVLLRGVNVGGHRRLRPARLAEDLGHLGVVNIGAAGTFVARKRISRARLRAEFAERLPFETEIVICRGEDVLAVHASGAWPERPAPAGTVRFVSVLAGRPSSSPALPLSFPPKGRWLLRILARRNRFVIGEYRRDPKTIGYLGALDRVYGVRVTTRNERTLDAIVAALREVDA